MLELKDPVNLWRMYDRGHPIAIATNYGWKKDLTNVMGAGIAKQAKERFPKLPREYGQYCYDHHLKHPRAYCIPSTYFAQYNLFLCASKKLDPYAPNQSWRASASISQIWTSCVSLQEIASAVTDSSIFIPRLGCANGGLDWNVVRTIMEPVLSNQFVVCNIE